MGTRTRLALIGVLFGVPLAVEACVGDTTSTVDGSTGPDSSKDSTTSDVGTGDGGNTCTPGCVNDASALRGCDAGVATNMACSFGCLEAPNAHCGVFNPTGLVEPSDFETTGLSDFDPCPADAGQGLIGCSFVLHTDTGKIDDGSSNVLRPINANPTVVEVGNGIGFHVASYDAGTEKLAIFTFKNFYLRGGEIHFAGPNPVAIVAQNDIEIHGLVDTIDTNFFGACNAAAGGGAPGNVGQPSTSLGGGGAGDSTGTTYSAGGGGGGSAGAGGGGGSASFNYNGGTSGPAFSEGFNPLRGGGGGGGGGSGTIGLGGPGGAGGGAIALFANGTVTISPGGGTTWGVNAGGCGSPPGAYYSSNGGGGAGGAILVQAHAIVGVGNAGLAANGGAGGNSSPGSRGAINTTPAPGATSATCYGIGGNGGAGTTQATAGGQPGACSQAYYGGGGGGGLGRIAIGSYVPPALDGGFIVSPAPTTLAPPIE